MAVNMKYISMNIEPNGKTPAAGMTKLGSAYHGASGIGRGILLTRQGESYLPLQFLPKIVPATDNGMATNNQIAIILTMTEMGMALIVPYPVSRLNALMCGELSQSTFRRNIAVMIGGRSYQQQHN